MSDISQSGEARRVAVTGAVWILARSGYAFLVMVALIVVCPYVLYPMFLMRVLCIALFACAFNLMIGYVGLLSFGHAAFFGMGAYIAAWTMKFWHVDAVIAIAAGRHGRRRCWACAWATWRSAAPASTSP